LSETTRTPEPFPWLCGQCGAEKVFPEKIAYETSLRYEGRDYQVTVSELPALKCRECGAVLLNNESDAHLSSAFRAKLKLLQPETIREGRKRLSLNQREFAELLGVAEESVSRWETGAQMQSRVVDKIMRAYFASPEARRVLDAARTDFAVGGIVVRLEPGEIVIRGRIQKGVVVLQAASVPEGTEVAVHVPVAPVAANETVSGAERQRVSQIMDRIAALPDENPADSFSDADHDRVLYGAP
jgi:putative zinc finger/helix-turn-helix YgiT family protein